MEAWWEWGEAYRKECLLLTRNMKSTSTYKCTKEKSIADKYGSKKKEQSQFKIFMAMYLSPRTTKTQKHPLIKLICSY